MKTALQLGVALSVALIAGVFIFRWMSVKSAQVERAPKAQAVETVEIVTAAEKLPRGTRLEAGMLTVTPFLEASLPEGRITDPEALEGRILMTSLGAREPVTEAKLAPAGTVSLGVGDMIAAGKRAMSVRGNEVLGLGGFVHPGDHVDVLVTLDGVGEDNSPVTKLVLENAPVLATGAELAPTQDGREPSPVDIYTLEVTPDQSEILALAATKGTLHFALRGGSDNATVVTTGKDVQAALSSLLAESEAAPKTPPARPKKQKPTPTVELITGSERTSVTFGDARKAGDQAQDQAPRRDPGPAVALSHREGR
jgi:pilus assembly protein CpaB